MATMAICLIFLRILTLGYINMPYYKSHRPKPIKTNNRIYVDFCPYLKTTPNCVDNNCICISSFTVDKEDKDDK